ncbi:MAG: AbrB/MazE/SpoVT family DNA-binding domain-containing protein [Vulcanimicrobiaceae bacterium]
MPEFRAKLTSKNQLTLPKGVSALLGVKSGDTVRFTVNDDGGVGVSALKPSERLAPWVGYFKRTGSAMRREERDAFVRELRGPRDAGERG